VAFRRALVLCAIGLIGLIAAAPASAVSPQRIYADLADNGRLDGTYSRADLERALNVRQVLRTDANPAPTVRWPASATRSRPPKDSTTLPFTGLDLALLTVGGCPLLLLGFGVRRLLTARNAARVGVVGG
jgi:hypothetical protein